MELVEPVIGRICLVITKVSVSCVVVFDVIALVHVLLEFVHHFLRDLLVCIDGVITMDSLVMFIPSVIFGPLLKLFLKLFLSSKVSKIVGVILGVKGSGLFLLNLLNFGLKCSLFSL